MEQRGNADDAPDGDLEGDFHLHLTVSAEPRPVDGADVAGIAARLGLKHTRIELPRGDVPSQPMLTAHRHGTLPEQRAAAAHLTARLRAEGIEVIRVKIEAAAANRGVPERDADVPAGHPDRHFEQHVKVLLDDGQVARLAADVAAAGAHLSRNARRVRVDGRHERFVTRRCYGVGRATARAGLAELLAALRAGGYPVIDVEEEYVVHDDRPAVDAGWIDPPDFP